MTKSSDSMKGLFFIMKGSYERPREGEEDLLKCYNPDEEGVREWYQVRDCKTFYGISGGSSLEKALETIERTIKTYKTAENYFRHLSEISSEDYYEVHYLGHTPLNYEQRTNKAEGRCPRVSPSMFEIYKKAYILYGDYFGAQIENAEDKAYEYIKNDTPLKKTKKLFKKLTSATPENNTPVKHLIKTREPQKDLDTKESAPKTINKLKKTNSTPSKSFKRLSIK